jgi:hypothetical protein
MKEQDDMKILTLEQQRERINNINHAEQTNRSYLRRHRIREYLPGQATYNLGDYPARFSIEPTEYDYNLLKKLSEENGFELTGDNEEKAQKEEDEPYIDHSLFDEPLPEEEEDAEEEWISADDIPPEDYDAPNIPPDDF